MEYAENKLLAVKIECKVFAGEKNKTKVCILNIFVCVCVTILEKLLF